MPKKTDIGTTTKRKNVASKSDKKAAASDSPSPSKSKRKKAAPKNGRRAKRKTAKQAVRDYLAAVPAATNREVIDALAAQGIVIDDYLPAAIRGENKKNKKQPPKKKTPADAIPALPPVRRQTTLFVPSPVHDEFVNDLKRGRTHSAVIKNIHILIAKLQRLAEIMDALQDDDWEIALLPEYEGLMCSAWHPLASDLAQVRSRIAKLGIKPNEVVLVAGE